jgi:cytochrome oxidase Cu insertion factor (SCO1/SenC/PrrC family)
MKKFVTLLLVLTCLAVTAFAQQTAQPQQPAPPKTHLKVGQPAPEFSLTDTEGKEVKLSDYKGKKNVVLAFYVLAFTGG